MRPVRDHHTARDLSLAREFWPVDEADSRDNASHLGSFGADEIPSGACVADVHHILIQQYITSGLLLTKKTNLLEPREPK